MSTIKGIVVLLSHLRVTSTPSARSVWRIYLSPVFSLILELCLPFLNFAGWHLCVSVLAALLLQCADLGQLIEQNKDTMSSGYDSASKVWTGIEIVAQLELLGLTAALFIELRVNVCCYYPQH